MYSMRLLLRDRVTASAIALLISYLLLVQGLVGAIATGAMAAAPTDMQVICTSSGYEASAEVGSGTGVPGKSAFQCPCPSLCGIASTAQLGIPADVSINLAAYETGPGNPAVVAAEFFRPVLRGLIGEPRAPPVVL